MCKETRKTGDTREKEDEMMDSRRREGRTEQWFKMGTDLAKKESYCRKGQRR